MQKRLNLEGQDRTNEIWRPKLGNVKLRGLNQAIES
jgi:hypothetical protein